MKEAMSKLRELILKHLDPEYFKFEEGQPDEWMQQIKSIKARIFDDMHEEMLGNMDCKLVERHLRQVQYECRYLAETLYHYQNAAHADAEPYITAGVCLEEIRMHIETRYSNFFNLSRRNGEEPERIRVLFSVDALAYFFKLLNKAGGLDATPNTQLMKAIAGNFITPGIGMGHISSKSVTTKYKQVVQATALSVRKLLTRMLCNLDEEFG